MSANSGFASRTAATRSFNGAQYSFKPRFLAFLAVAALILGIVLGLVLSGLTSRSASAAGLGRPSPTTDPSYISVQVQKGDTIWTIAVNHGISGIDPRMTVRTIRMVNHLTSAIITPGQVLLVPVSKR